jgi:hypothetical protein
VLIENLTNGDSALHQISIVDVIRAADPATVVGIYGPAF